MRSPVRRLLRYRRAHGARQTAAAVAARIGGLAYTEERLIIIAKQLQAAAAELPPGGLRVEEIERRHLPALAELNRRRRAPPEADRRFARYLEEGLRGFAAMRAQELVGYCWWSDRADADRFPDLRDGSLGIELGERDVYGSDVFILAEHRGVGVASGFLRELESVMWTRGYARFWGYVVSTNRPARWTYSRLGYSSMWTVSRRRIGWLQWATRSDSRMDLALVQPENARARAGGKVETAFAKVSVPAPTEGSTRATAGALARDL